MCFHPRRESSAGSSEASMPPESSTSTRIKTARKCAAAGSTTAPRRGARLPATTASAGAGPESVFASTASVTFPRGTTASASNAAKLRGVCAATFVSSWSVASVETLSTSSTTASVACATARVSTLRFGAAAATFLAKAPASRSSATTAARSLGPSGGWSRASHVAAPAAAQAASTASSSKRCRDASSARATASARAALASTRSSCASHPFVHSPSKRPVALSAAGAGGTVSSLDLFFSGGADPRLTEAIETIETADAESLSSDETEPSSRDSEAREPRTGSPRSFASRATSRLFSSSDVAIVGTRLCRSAVPRDFEDWVVVVRVEDWVVGDGALVRQLDVRIAIRPSWRE
mmetsp:Transcript_19654/g.67481  ORF Transcript_19654/g.67481 Transcript_19654/m.67481 type:complete len:351 (-) Transcript_19654:186-1238(-)